jgi:hypothetical protein
MELATLLERKRKAVLGQWFQLVVETYPLATSNLLAKQEDQFRNPVGHAIAESLSRIYDQIQAGMDAGELTDALDGIIRIRSIQDFTPSEAVSFVFDLKTVIREVVDAEERGGDALSELASLDSKIDRVALLAFEKYMTCREKLHEIRNNEIKKRMVELLQTRNAGAAAAAEEKQSICDEA